MPLKIDGVLAGANGRVVPGEGGLPADGGITGRVHFPHYLLVCWRADVSGVHGKHAIICIVWSG